MFYPFGSLPRFFQPQTPAAPFLLSREWCFGAVSSWWAHTSSSYMKEVVLKHCEEVILWTLASLKESRRWQSSSAHIWKKKRVVKSYTKAVWLPKVTSWELTGTASSSWWACRSRGTFPSHVCWLPELPAAIFLPEDCRQRWAVGSGGTETQSPRQAGPTRAAEVPAAQRDAAGGSRRSCVAAGSGRQIRALQRLWALHWRLTFFLLCSPKNTTATPRAAWRKMGTSSPAAALVPALSLGWPLLKHCWGRKWLSRWRHPSYWRNEIQTWDRE